MRLVTCHDMTHTTRPKENAWCRVALQVEGCHSQKLNNDDVRLDVWMQWHLPTSGHYGWQLHPLGACLGHPCTNVLYA